jgi:hypothetical protein
LSGERRVAFLTSLEFLAQCSSFVMIPWKRLSHEHFEALCSNEIEDDFDVSGDNVFSYTTVWKE